MAVSRRNFLSYAGFGTLATLGHPLLSGCNNRTTSGSWIAMRRVDREDPYFAQLKQREAELGQKKNSEPALGRALPAIIKSPHLWQANLSATPPTGTHSIHVRTTDMWGQTYADRRIIRVLANAAPTASVNTAGTQQNKG